jgi:hypothetical protein
MVERWTKDLELYVLATINRGFAEFIDDDPEKAVVEMRSELTEGGYLTIAPDPNQPEYVEHMLTPKGHARLKELAPGELIRLP